MSLPLLVPDTPYLSWATIAMAATFLIDVSADIGEYLRALDAATRWSSDKRRLREGRRAVFIASLEALVVSAAVLSASALAVWHFTRGVDHRMILVLGGLSRLEAATFVCFISIKTPRWVGVYYSAPHERVQQEVDEVDIPTLRFHVRWSVMQYFGFNFFLNLPFAGRPLSFLIGFIAAFFMSAGIFFARRAPVDQRDEAAMGMATLLAFFSAVLFADGCHYIQVVWGKGRWMSEWVLGLVSFTIWFANVLVGHRRMWFETEEKSMLGKHVSTHDRQQRMPISLVYSHVFGSKAKLWESSAGSLKPLLKKSSEDESRASSIAAARDQLEKVEDSSAWDLIKKRWSTVPSELGLSRSDSAIWVIVSFASLFIVVINIGATVQMNVVKENFDTVHETLYGSIDAGPVCAFNKVGGKIATFESRRKAHFAGYKVAHCGACGECSDWYNMRLQYTTRTYLAAASARCGKKSLFGGRDAVSKCLNDPPIEFQGKCAECWTEDIFCARNNCAFIFLQSNLINTVGNFEVGPDTITSATCEEAMCELEFVPCTGANRRRMNIQSMIQRPGDQQCGIVDVDWADIFGEGTAPSDWMSGTGAEEL